MQAKKRYILVFLSCAFLAYCYFGGYRLKNDPSLAFQSTDLPSFLEAINNLDTQHSVDRNDDIFSSPADLALDDTVIDNYGISYNTKSLPQKTASTTKKKNTASCRMETCFDFTKCYEDFLVYVYPPEPVNSLGSAPPISLNYQKIISAIRESRYYTTEPDRACLFVLGIDTLDRDSLSEDYVRNVPSRLQRLLYWNNGRNHIIFNLYSGTWPDYAENSLGFDTGEAILAKASMSIQQIRPSFDISIPLFHKQHPLRAGNTGTVISNNFPANKKYLLAFKGKR